MSERIGIVGTGSDGAALLLEAVLGRGARGAGVVAPPHPMYGGRLDNPVVSAIADGLEQAGIAPLRFNFQGIGASDGVASADATQADADFRAAFKHLASLRTPPYVGAGYSFGAATALRVAARGAAVAQLILLSPPLFLLDQTSLRSFAGPIAIVVGDEDQYLPLAELEQAVAGLANVRLRVLANVDHFYGDADFEELAWLIAATANEV